MKSTIKTLLCLMTAVCLLCALAACSPATSETVQEPAPAAEEPVQLTTMGDVFAYESGNNGYNEKNFVYVFEKDGVTYRAVADMPADVSEAVWAVDFFDEHRDEKIQELIAPLPIAQLDNLTEHIPAQEEIAALVGKTGQELKDEGWIISSWQLDDMEFILERGAYAYTVIMEGDYTPNENYDFDEDTDFAPLKVKSITYYGIGDATRDILDVEPEGES